jgi:hypothetical protein
MKVGIKKRIVYQLSASSYWQASCSNKPFEKAE